jgi:RNA 2',3'-cyclic 3'-phosphodiesterase
MRILGDPGGPLPRRAPRVALTAAPGAPGNAQPPRRPRVIRRRIFVAVTLAPVLLDAVSGVRARLAEANDGLRWVPSHNLHFTLKFLGGITPSQLTKVIAAAREVAVRTKPFAITLAGLGAFPSPRGPRVLWIGVSAGAGSLIALAEDLETALRRVRVPREHRPFRPHLTIARVRPAAPMIDLSRAVADLRGFEIGSQTVDALRVMESHLKPSGAVYEELEEVRLRAPA